MDENKQEQFLNKIEKESEKVLNDIIAQGINNNNVDVVGKIVDIHKDIANEKYWKMKEEDIKMRYKTRSSYGENEIGNYGDGSYGRRGVKGTGPYSRYRDGGSYGRRGVPGTGRRRYRGEDALDGMHEEYQNYSDGKDMMNMGNYGAKEDMTESLECMLESMVEFIKAVKEEADSPEEIQLVEKYAHKISQL